MCLCGFGEWCELCSPKLHPGPLVPLEDYGKAVRFVFRGGGLVVESGRVTYVHPEVIFLPPGSADSTLGGEKP